MEPLIRTSRARRRARIDDNWVDRLSSRYTVIILLAFTVLVGIASWVRNPMTCWLPKNYDIDQRPFLKLYCWVENTYYLPYTREIPKPHEHEQKSVLIYYQWIPYILLAQAFFFWLPSGVWHYLSARSGLDTKSILEMAVKLHDTTKLDSREKKLENLTTYLNYFFSHNGRRVMRPARSNPCCAPCTNDSAANHNKACCSGSFLTVSYSFVKFLYLVNLLLQMLALAGLLNTHYFKHGANYINFHRGANTTEDGALWNSPVFPRVAFCDYVLRELGNNRRYTTQCVMNYNIYLERLYLFMWFWIVVLLFITSVDFFVWFLRNVIRTDRLNFIQNQLHVGDAVTRVDPDMTSRFVDEYLGQDGVLVLRVITQNVSAVTSADITGRLWRVWRAREGEPSIQELMEDHDAKGR